MRTLEEAHSALTDLKYEIDHNRNSLGSKLEVIGDFIEKELSDVISLVDQANDRIEELEDELKDAQNAAQEWEDKYNALV